MLDESGLLVVLFRVRTTLLRSAFSFSSLSRRASSSGSWLASAFCGKLDGVIRLKETSGKTNKLPHLTPVSLPLSFRLTFDPYPRRRTIYGAEITSAASTRVGAGAPRPASAPASASASARRRPSRPTPVLGAPAPAPIMMMPAFPPRRRRRRWRPFAAGHRAAFAAAPRWARTTSTTSVCVCMGTVWAPGPAPTGRAYTC